MILNTLYSKMYSFLFKILYRYHQQNNNSFMDLKYMKYNKEYIYRLKFSNDPIEIRHFVIFNEYDEDVSKYVLPYLGPNYDCHNNDLTPHTLNYHKLKFIEYNDDGQEYHAFVFVDNDIINLKI